MKPNLLPRTCAGLWLAVIAVLISLAVPSRAFEVIDPSGASYQNVSESSRFAAGWDAFNLFDADVSAAVPGSPVTANAEYAKSGGGDAWVAFELDQSYNIGSLFWAQRNGSTTGDNMQRVSIWASEEAAFATSDPGTAPNNVVSLLPNTGAPVWQEYILTNAFTGRYFLLHLEQTDVRGNPGGAELRFGLTPPPTPPVVTREPSNVTVYAGGTARFSVTATGAVPISYRWQKNGTPLNDGGNISGATTANLTLRNVAAGDAGSYSVKITNPNGTTDSAPATLALAAAPANDFSKLIVSNAPVAYWQLNEAAGATVAADLAGSFNGTYGTASQQGAEGPRAPAQPGFSASNTGVRTTAFTVESAVVTPPLRINTNQATILAWIKPEGAQQQYTGIAYARGSGTSAGLIFGEDGTKLGYQWNNDRYQFNSAITIPSDQWSMVAMVVTPTNTTLYGGFDNRLRSAVDPGARAAQTFDAPLIIGLDTDLGQSARTFNGTIDEVAVFNRALTAAEIQALYAAGAGALQAVPVEITGTLTNQALFYGETLLLEAKVAGTQPIAVQWFKNNAAIAGATNTSYSVASVTTANAGTYHFTASNSVNSVTSDPVEVTVANQVLRVLDPTGKVYTNVTESSFFAASWKATNLFTTDMTDKPLGTVMASNPEYAKSGPGDAWVAFQVDKVYDIGALYWAQRNGTGTGDNMQILSLWTSQNTPFTAEDPGTAPDVVINLVPNSGAPVWLRYLLESAVRGRYFLMHLEQTDVRGNPGGAEMRLGLVEAPGTVTPVSIVTQPANQTLYLGETLHLEAQVAGTAPIAVQWYKGTTAINGATNRVLSITNATLETAGSYYFVASNGATNTVTSANAVVTVQNFSLNVLDPSGSVYTNVRHSSAFAANWGATNLFTTDVSNVPVGGNLSGAEYAKSGGGDAWVAFEVDKAYEVGAVFWAQRNGSTTGDNMQVLSLWTSSTGPFETADPGRPADAVIQLQPNVGAPVWLRYPLASNVNGRYFLMHLEQTDVRGNPGGAEMRLGLYAGPQQERRLTITRASNGVVLNWPAGGTLQESTNLEAWSDVAGATPGATIPTSGAHKFYRVRF